MKTNAELMSLAKEGITQTSATVWVVIFQRYTLTFPLACTWVCLSRAGPPWPWRWHWRRFTLPGVNRYKAHYCAFLRKQPPKSPGQIIRAGEIERFIGANVAHSNNINTPQLLPKKKFGRGSLPQGAALRSDSIAFVNAALTHQA